MHILSAVLEELLFILPTALAGVLVGSALSVFGKQRLNAWLGRLRGDSPLGLLPAAALGVASPLCLYGTLPVAAVLARQGVREDRLAAFMLSSILLNPQLLLYTSALGGTVTLARLLSCLGCGVAAGLAVRLCFRRRRLFCFAAFAPPADRDTAHPTLWGRYACNVGRNLRATGPWLALGVLLAALLRTSLPHGLFAGVPSWAGVPLMALLGIPFYVCGGGAVPLMHSWLELGISVGAVVAFTVTGAATKVTNLSALLSVMSLRHALLYTLFITLAAMLCGAAVQGCLFFLR